MFWGKSTDKVVTVVVTWPVNGLLYGFLDIYVPETGSSIRVSIINKFK